MPHFVLAAFLVIVCRSTQLVQASAGADPEPSDIFNFVGYDWRKMVMPVIALACLPAAYIARVTRASVLEVLNQDYIRTARAKGLTRARVVLRHTIKNAMIPVLTVLGPIAAILLSGSFIIETMFGINGIGSESISPSSSATTA